MLDKVAGLELGDRTLLERSATEMTQIAIQKAKEDWRKVRRKLSLADQFVLHSEMISGRGFQSLADWNTETLARHRGLVQTLTRPGCTFLGNIELINSGLTDRQSGWLRTGEDAAFKFRIPKGNRLPKLLRDLNREITNGLAQLQYAPIKEKAAFARYVHDMLFCLHAFKEANSRTARLAKLHIRALLGLPFEIIQYRDSVSYLRRVDRYRARVFIPRYCPPSKKRKC